MALKKSEQKSSGRINPRQVLEEHRKSYADAMQEELEVKGVTFFEPELSLWVDKDYLILPQNITDVSNKELGEYLNAFTQQKMYMRTLLGWAELMLEQSKREYHLVADPLYKELNKTKLSEKAKDLEVNSSDEVIESYNAMNDIKMKIVLLNHTIDNLTDGLFMISREVSRRSGDFDNERRNSNVTGR